MTQLVTPAITTVKFNYFKAGTYAMNQLNELIFLKMQYLKLSFLLKQRILKIFKTMEPIP